MPHDSGPASMMHPTMTTADLRFKGNALLGDRASRASRSSSICRGTIVFLTMVAAVGCAGPTLPASDPAPGISSPIPAPPPDAGRVLSPSQFGAAIAETRTTINVHIPFEGALNGTDLQIPFDRVTAEAHRLPADRNAPLAIYCKSGRMSAVAAEELARLGYSDVVELRGGMDGWVGAGLPLAPP